MSGNTAKTKQVIIMREDLNLSSGKMIAQGAHASVSAILNKNKADNKNNIDINITEEELEWFTERFTKVTLGVKDEESLMLLYNEAKERGLNVSRPIIDAGFTELDKPTLTCIAIGPNYNERIDEVTGKLRLFTGTSKEKRIRKFLKNLLKKGNDKSQAKHISDLLS